MESSVVDTVIESPHLFQRILDACGVQKLPPIGQDRNALCPFHDDKDPSFTIRWQQGLGFCQSGCGIITLFELVERTQHGVHSQGDAARWVEEFIGLEKPVRKPAAAPVTSIDSYLASKGLPAGIGEKFCLQDCEVWDPHVKGFASGILMPTGVNARPRVRVGVERPRWAGSVALSGQKSKYTSDLAMPAYGIPQFEYNNIWGRHILLVEGESDVHALHAGGFTSVLGIPGASYSKVIPDALMSVFEAHGLPECITVWDEGDSGASGLIRDLRRILPGFVDGFDDKPKLDVVDGKLQKVKDPAELWSNDPQADIFGSSLAICFGASRPLDPTMDDVMTAMALTELGPNDPWLRWGVEGREGVPPVGLSRGQSFQRSRAGWDIVKVSKDGETNSEPLCSSFYVSKIVRVEGGEEHFVLCAPLERGEWVEYAAPSSVMASSEKMTTPLGHIGVTTWQKSRSDVTRLVAIMVQDAKDQGRIERRAQGSGWFGGLSAFAGVDADSIDPFVNKLRPDPDRDLLSSAREHRRLCEPVLSMPDRGGKLLAPLLAFGATCASPTIMPLDPSCIPVVLLHGLGGGGKTMIQQLCTSIWASPGASDAVMFNADATPAALFSRALTSRDLPMIVDDVTQMRPLAGSMSRGMDARMEAFADLAMRIFNRKPYERANRDGSRRISEPFRSTAVFSAERSLTDGSASLTAGHMRRVVSLECQPLKDRGLLGRDNSKLMRGLERARDEYGGVVGSLIVQHVRNADADGSLKKRFQRFSVLARELAEDSGVEPTQGASIALSAFGFSLYLIATGDEVASSDDSGIALLRLALGCDGVGVKADDISGANRLFEAAQDLAVSKPNRFWSSYRESSEGVLKETGQVDHEMNKIGFGGLLGRWRFNARTKRVELCLLRSGVKELELSYGIGIAALKAAEGRGVSHKSVRFPDEKIAKCWVFEFEPETLPDDDDPSDPDDSVDPTNSGEPGRLFEDAERSEVHACNDPAAGHDGESERFSAHIENSPIGSTSLEAGNSSANFGGSFGQEDSADSGGHAGSSGLDSGAGGGEREFSLGSIEFAARDSRYQPGVEAESSQFEAGSCGAEGSGSGESFDVVPIGSESQGERVPELNDFIEYDFVTGRYKLTGGVDRDQGAAYLAIQADAEFKALIEQAEEGGFSVRPAPAPGDAAWDQLDGLSDAAFDRLWESAGVESQKQVDAYRIYLLGQLHDPNRFLT